VTLIWLKPKQMKLNFTDMLSQTFTLKSNLKTQMKKSYWHH